MVANLQHFENLWKVSFKKNLRQLVDLASQPRLRKHIFDRTLHFCLSKTFFFWRSASWPRSMTDFQRILHSSISVPFSHGSPAGSSFIKCLWQKIIIVTQQGSSVGRFAIYKSKKALWFNKSIMNFRTENLCEPAIAPQTLTFTVLNYILVDTGNSSFRLPESKYENHFT